ncbi:MAG TPA: class I SAM-dependent methyltransferase [Candidatus Binatia bacterium]|nr:class I SAM-dependent methyltransferase [Candidatus Binatia bacterium]
MAMSVSGSAGAAQLDPGRRRPATSAAGADGASIPVRPCPVCGADGAVPHHGRGSTLRRCRCGLVFVDPEPDAEEIAAREYEAFQGGLRHETAEMFTLYYRNYPDDPVVRGFRSTVRRLHDLTGGGRLLDVGIGTGLFLHLAEQAGFEPLGVEISPSAAERAREEFGVDAWVGDFEAFSTDRPFDALAMADVLEHSGEPRRFLEHAAGLLRPGGALFVAVPNRRSTLFWAADALARIPGLAPVADRIYVPNHYTYFTPATLARLVREVGFEVVDVRCESPYLGRYRFSLPVKLGLVALIALGRMTGLEARVEVLAVRR